MSQIEKQITTAICIDVCQPFKLHDPFWIFTCSETLFLSFFHIYTIHEKHLLTAKVENYETIPTIPFSILIENICKLNAIVAN